MYYQPLVHDITQSKCSDAYQFRHGNPNFCYTGLLNMHNIQHFFTTRNTKCTVNKFPAARQVSAQWQLPLYGLSWVKVVRAGGVGLVIVVAVVRGWDWGSSLTIVIGRLGVGGKLLHIGKSTDKPAALKCANHTHTHGVTLTRKCRSQRRMDPWVRVPAWGSTETSTDTIRYSQLSLGLTIF